MNTPVETVDLDFQQVESQLDQIEQQMGEEAVRSLRLLLSGYVALLQLIERSGTTIRRLRRLLFGPHTEKTRDVVSPPDSPNNDENDSSKAGADGSSSGGSSSGGSSSGGSSSGGSNSGGSNSGGSNLEDCNLEDSEDANSDDTNSDDTKRRPGHGRFPAAAYLGCKQVVVEHQAFPAGDNCPECQNGTLYRQAAWGQVAPL